MSLPIEKVYVKAQADQYNFFLAMASKTRLAIIELLQHKEMSIKDLSSTLQISSAVVTKHIQLLEEADIVESSMRPGVHGLLKICRLKMDEATVIFNTSNESPAIQSYTEVEVPISAYTKAKASAPCGMSFDDRVFGFIDDPKYFMASNRYGLSIIWLNEGYLQYPIDLMDVKKDKTERLEISLEICSEHHPKNDEAASNVDFYLNDELLGTCSLPGNLSDRKGRFTPAWWSLGSEYGLLIQLAIDETGVYLDEQKISDKPLSYFLNQSESEMSFRIETAKVQPKNGGGFQLFGKGFGDYDQGLLFRFLYRKENQ
jgi:predicted transcriptional regulator